MKKIIKDLYLSKFNKSDCVGIEIEIPIVNDSDDKQISMEVIQKMFNMFLKHGFIIYDYDNGNNIISVVNKTKDTISLEYSVNTVEFSLGKEESLFKLKSKFEKYFKLLSNFLKKYNYYPKLTGINPNYKYINRTALNHNRYKVIEKLLKNNNDNLYGEFCSYICSLQTHVNIEEENIYKLMNVFTIIEDLKNEIFSNSYMEELDLSNSRKFLWENSNFTKYNTGKNKIYNSNEEIIEDYLNRNIFFVKRNNNFFLLDKEIKIRDFLKNICYKVYDYDGNVSEIVPAETDIKECFRSYKSVELTKYGTLEIRTDCTPSYNNIFYLVAFNVGIATNYLNILKYLEKGNKLSKEILCKFAIEGLKLRNKGEEVLMKKKKIGIWMYENDNGINIKKKLVSSLENMGYEVYANFDMRDCYLKNGKVYAKDGYCLSDVDIFYHMNADEQNQYQNDILRLLELSGVHVFNDYQSFIYCKDKVISNLLLRKNGVLVPPSMLINNKLTKDDLKSIIDEYGTIIVKPRTNHGGKGIIKIDNFELFCDFYEATKSSVNDYYLEKYIPFKSHDYRVEIFNGEVVGTYCRGKCGTYKTNISSGGSMEDIVVPEEFKKVALKAAKTLNVTTTIVDMILSEEEQKIYVLEVNPIMGIFLEEGMKAGTKMPVQTKIPESFKTDKIKLECIINYIDNCLKNN